jgi:hypothetical protein
MEVEKLLEMCHQDLSFVEWAMESGILGVGDEKREWSTGPPVVVMSCSWDSDWGYMCGYLAQEFGEDACVWIDILAVNQHFSNYTLVSIKGGVLEGQHGNLTVECGEEQTEGLRRLRARA